MWCEKRKLTLFPSAVSNDGLWCLVRVSAAFAAQTQHLCVCLGVSQGLALHTDAQVCVQWHTWHQGPTAQAEPPSNKTAIWAGFVPAQPASESPLTSLSGWCLRELPEALLWMHPWVVQEKREAKVFGTVGYQQVLHLLLWAYAVTVWGWRSCYKGSCHLLVDRWAKWDKHLSHTDNLLESKRQRSLLWSGGPNYNYKPILLSFTCTFISSLFC